LRPLQESGRIVLTPAIMSNDSFTTFETYCFKQVDPVDCFGFNVWHNEQEEKGEDRLSIYAGGSGRKSLPLIRPTGTFSLREKIDE
jgi:hypothetical protein